MHLVGNISTWVMYLMVDGPNSNITILWTPRFEWYMVTCRPKNGHHNDTCLEEIRLHAHNTLILLRSTINKLVGGGGGAIWPFNENENLPLDNVEDISHELQKHYEEIGYGLELDLLIILYSSGVSYPTQSGLVEKRKHLKTHIT